MANETTLSVAEKLALLNTLPILEWDVLGEGGGYVMVAVNDETREVLQKLGYDDHYIEQEQAEVSDTEAEIDIWNIAAECGADRFKPSVGFLVSPADGQEG